MSRDISVERFVYNQKNIMETAARKFNDIKGARKFSDVKGARKLSDIKGARKLSDINTEVKHIDEHYQETVDKIMSEFFADEIEDGRVSNDKRNKHNDEKENISDNETKSLNSENHSSSRKPFHQRSNSWPEITNKNITDDVMKNNPCQKTDTKQNKETKCKDIETQTELLPIEYSDNLNIFEKNYEGISIPTRNGDFNYENIHFAKYNDSTKENFHLLHRYHLANTLPVGCRNKMLIEIRALGVDRVNICLFGSPGCGKSALLNTMYGVITSQYVEHSPERKLGKRYRQCVTNRRLELRLTENISILDNRGMNFSKASLLEAKKQCEGLREAEEEIPPDWKSNISQKGRDIMKLCNKRMLLRNRVHCPIVVSSITQQLDKNAMKRLIYTLKQACYCDPIVIILTNIHDPESTRTYMAKSRKTYFETLGCKTVHEVNVYTSSNHRNNIHTDEKIINILFECCMVGDLAIATTLNNYRKSACC